MIRAERKTIGYYQTMLIKLKYNNIKTKNMLTRAQEYGSRKSIQKHTRNAARMF